MDKITTIISKTFAENALNLRLFAAIFHPETNCFRTTNTSNDWHFFQHQTQKLIPILMKNFPRLFHQSWIEYLIVRHFNATKLVFWLSFSFIWKIPRGSKNAQTLNWNNGCSSHSAYFHFLLWSRALNRHILDDIVRARNFQVNASARPCARTYKNHVDECRWFHTISSDTNHHHRVECSVNIIACFGLDWIW